MEYSPLAMSEGERQIIAQVNIPRDVASTLIGGLAEANVARVNRRTLLTVDLSPEQDRSLQAKVDTGLSMADAVLAMTPLPGDNPPDDIRSLSDLVKIGEIVSPVLKLDVFSLIATTPEHEVLSTSDKTGSLTVTVFKSPSQR